MHGIPDWLLPALGAAALVAVPVRAALVRGRAYAIFGFLILALSLPGALVSHARHAAWLGPGVLRLAVDALFVWGIVAAALHLLHLVRARLRGPAFRLGVSVPGQTFVAAGFLAGIWQLLLAPLRLLAAGLGVEALLPVWPWLDFVPFVVALGSIVTSSRRVPEWVSVRLGVEGPAELTRVPVVRHRRRAPPAGEQRPLRVAQIADPHLGPWQSVERLRQILDALLEHEPDLVLCTGDYLTMEGQGTPGALAEALAPLRRVAGRSFAVFGNHDHEAPDEVRDALAASGVRLLVDEEAVAETPIGPVQILGADWVRRGRAEHLGELFTRHPRRNGHVRLLLLHDPHAFRHVPPGEVDLTLSGHTHGGQLGLVSLGFDWTVLSRSAWPDHGLFARGASRLYVHRGTGFYGFPLRIGVPPELSILEVLP